MLNCLSWLWTNIDVEIPPPRRDALTSQMPRECRERGRCWCLHKFAPHKPFEPRLRESVKLIWGNLNLLLWEQSVKHAGWVQFSWALSLGLYQRHFGSYAINLTTCFFLSIAECGHDYRKISAINNPAYVYNSYSCLLTPFSPISQMTPATQKTKVKRK